MKVAQELYEGVTVQGYGSIGLITYMRTDSVRLSDEFVKFTCTEGTSLNMALHTYTNVEENKLVATFLYNSGEELTFDNSFFLYCDVNYKYDTNEISGFEIKQAYLNEPNSHYKYENNIFYEYDPFNSNKNEEIDNATLSLKESYKENKRFGFKKAGRRFI